MGTTFTRVSSLRTSAMAACGTRSRIRGIVRIVSDRSARACVAGCALLLQDSRRLQTVLVAPGASYLAADAEQAVTVLARHVPTRSGANANMRFHLRPQVLRRPPHLQNSETDPSNVLNPTVPVEQYGRRTGERRVEAGESSVPSDLLFDKHGSSRINPRARRCV